MLKDEVEACLLAQVAGAFPQLSCSPLPACLVLWHWKVPEGGIKPLELGPSKVE